MTLPSLTNISKTTALTVLFALLVGGGLLRLMVDDEAVEVALPEPARPGAEHVKDASPARNPAIRSVAALSK